MNKQIRNEKLAVLARQFAAGNLGQCLEYEATDGSGNHCAIGCMLSEDTLRLLDHIESEADEPANASAFKFLPQRIQQRIEQETGLNSLELDQLQDAHDEWAGKVLWCNMNDQDVGVAISRARLAAAIDQLIAKDVA